MNKNVKSVLFLCLIIGIFTIKVNHTKAVTNDTTKDEYTVRYIKPSEQITSERFYHVKYEPGTKHYLRAAIYNYSDHAIKIRTTINTATTADGGGFYNTNNVTYFDRHLKYPLSKIGYIKKSDRLVTIKPNQVRYVAAVVKMPDDNIRGIIEGQLKFERVKKLHQVQGVQSRYSYAFGVIVEGTNPKVYPELNTTRIEPMLDNSYAAFGIGLTNKEPMLITGATIEASITRKGFFNKKYYRAANNIQIAPNSSFKFPVSTNYDRLVPGRYEMNMKVTAKNYWNKLPLNWQFKKEFTVDSDKASKVNQVAIKRPTNIWTYAATGSTILTGLLVAAYFYLRKD